MIPIGKGSGRILPLPVTPYLKEGSWEIISDSLPLLVETLPIQYFGQVWKASSIAKVIHREGFRICFVFFSRLPEMGEFF
jgi:hypothetical protein